MVFLGDVLIDTLVVIFGIYGVDVGDSHLRVYSGVHGFGRVKKVFKKTHTHTHKKKFKYFSVSYGTKRGRLRASHARAGSKSLRYPAHELRSTSVGSGAVAQALVPCVETAT